MPASTVSELMMVPIGLQLMLCPPKTRGIFQTRDEAVPHQHNLIDTNVALVILSMHLSKWPVNMLPTRLPRSRNSMSTFAATDVFERFQEDTPPMTREELLSKDHRQSLIENPRQAKMDRHAGFLFQNCLEEDARGWATPMLQQQEADAMFPDDWYRRQPLHREASGKLRRIDDAEKT